MRVVLASLAALGLAACGSEPDNSGLMDEAEFEAHQAGEHDHDHDGDGVPDHAPEDHEDHDHDGDGEQDHAPEDHDDHDHDHDHEGDDHDHDLA